MTSYDLTGTKTATNLAVALAGESQTRTRYLFYSETAKKEGFRSIEQVFLATADNERGHAEIFFEYLTSGLEETLLQPLVIVPAKNGTTLQNLLYAAEMENKEWTDFYPKCAKEAEEEGFHEIAVSFSKVGTIENRHERRFRNLHERCKYDMVYQLPYEVVWECGNCGLHITANGAPKACPACHHPQGFFQVACKDIMPLPRRR